MGRIIGLIVCTCLVIVGLRLTNLQYTDQTLKGGEDRTLAGRRSPRESYKLGKEMYLRGKYREAIQHLEGSLVAGNGLTGSERRQANDYLGRATSRLQTIGRPTVRAQSDSWEDTKAQTPANEPAAQDLPATQTDSLRNRVDHLMNQAQAALERNSRDEAIQFARIANQFAKDGKIKFGKGEVTPAAFLAKLQGPSSNVKTAVPDWAADDLPVGNAGNRQTIQQTAGVAESIEPETSARPAGQPLTTHEQAAALLVEARNDMKLGRYNEARQKALMAEELDVTYGLFEDRPEVVMTDLDQMAKTTTIARKTAKPKSAAPSVAQGSDADNRQAPGGTGPANAVSANANANPAKAQAVRLLELARDDMRNGNLDAAQSKADQAAQLNVAFKLFEDMPEVVLNDIAAQRAAQNLAQAKAPVADRVPTSKPQALQLLSKARTAIEQDRLDEARQLAIEADRLKAPYDLFDDRPELVLQDVARIAKRGPSTPGTPIHDTTTTATEPRDDFPVAATGNTGNQATAAAMKNLSPAQVQAIELLRQSRQLMKAGRHDEARAKAEEADNMNVTFPVFADRPDLVMSDLDAKLDNPNIATRQKPSRSPITTANASETESEANPFANNTQTSNTVPDAAEARPVLSRQYEDVSHADSIAEVPTSGQSASELYNRGMRELNRNNRQGAYAAFLAAHQTGQRLDNVRAQRLQDYLRELAPKKSRSGIQLTNNRQVSDSDVEVPGGEVQPAPLDAVQQEQMVRFERLRSDVLNAVFKAERLKDKDPEAALTLIDQTMSKVEGSEISEESAGSLMKQLNKSRSSLQTQIARQKPNIENKNRNDETKKVIDRGIEHSIRIEQEMAKLVEEFNDLTKQRRFPEAEQLAKKAMELNPNEPVAMEMFWRSRLQTRVRSNEKLQNDREESFWKQLDDVEQAAIVGIGDKTPLKFGDNWKEISKRRAGKYNADNRKRGEEELKIEKSLTKRISLHEDQAPLSEVMRKIQAVADVNIVMDTPGLDEEGASTNTLVSIDVTDIQVKSALNLILGRYNLAYMIDNEVLKITSRMRQQGELVVATYSVADLVIPIPDQTSQMADPFASISNPLGATSGGQFSVPPNHGQGFGQVGQNQAGTFDPATPSRRQRGNNMDPDFTSLTELITSTIAPDSWDQVGGPASIRPHETTLSLVIRQTQKIHEEITDLLSQLRRLQDLQVTIEVRFVTVSDYFFERIGVDFNFNLTPSTGLPNVDNTGLPLQTFGSVNLPTFGMSGSTASVQGVAGVAGVAGAAQIGAAGVAGQAGVQGAAGVAGAAGAAQAGGGAFFGAGPQLNLYNNPSNGSIVGMKDPTNFTQDLTVPFTQGSFQVGVPTFGNYNPQAGMEMGLAILSDIEAFFFIQAAQGDQRNNLLFAPKVTVFNGQTGFVTDSKSRPFVTSLIPTVGFASVGFQPQITTIPEGISLSVTAVVSSDRRFVRLSVSPLFSSITEVFTFSYQGGGGGGQQGQRGQAGQAGQNQQGGAGGFGGGQFGGQGGGQGFGIGGGIGGQGGGIGGQGGGQQGQQGQRGGAGGTITVQQPVVEQVTVRTTVSVPDGGTILLGGVKRLKEGRNMSGVPILNKIPYVSRLFKNTGVGRETESLMLMITPRIIIQEEEEELIGLPRT